ncbi:MAG TPA: hypothetical protein VD966_09350 [Pyrinomonadaceae bacterium]|nr:hypothetical protein [Pyrinomonadaceae bacterium]
MSPRAVSTRRMSRRKVTLLWVTGLAATVIALIYWEQAALLYVLATLGLAALLTVVALADLKGAPKDSAEPARADDAAAIGSGIATTLPSGASTAPRKTRRT